ncbi:MAG TPA: histidine phosphatase family protein [Dehalococcoidia bacterium]|nr:histidine phosphatase family protein [Dehalococcoidia bacterium]
MRLILVRHGESVGNFENRLQGQADYDLTELGRRQAALTADRLHALGTTAVYSSHLLRAHATAKAIGARLGTGCSVLEDVSEYHFGEMSGATYAEVRERFGTIASPAERIYPGEEGRDVFFRRVTEALWGVAEAHPGETVAVVSHGGPIALFCQAVLGLPYKRPMPFSISNCSLNVIEIEPGQGNAARTTRLIRLNDVCHLNSLV